MRIATWNVNSIRSRVERVEAWLARSEVDVLAIQETKAREDQFPYLPFEALGYEVAHIGLNQWNGVAIASRVGLAEITVGFPGMPSWGEPPAPEARAIGATCAGVRIWSVYVPNGRALDDPHMAYKLEWLDRLAAAGRAWLAEDPQAQIVIMGDWNVAPADEDVWSMEFYADKSHVSPGERAGFRGVVDAGYADLVRPHAPGPGVYTYWDYQQLRFQRELRMPIGCERGLWVRDGRVAGAAIARGKRIGKGASDHAPVVIELR